LEVSGQLHPRGKSPGTHWIGGWVDPRADLDDVEKWKFLPPPGFELRPLGHPARSKSLYWLRYPGTSVLDGGKWSASCHGCFTLSERAPGIHWKRGWVGPRAGLDTIEKRTLLTTDGNSTPVVQPTACCYTDWAIPAAQIIQRSIVGQMNDEWKEVEGYWGLIKYPKIYLQGVKATMNNVIQNSQCPVGIRTSHLPRTNQTRYLLTQLAQFGFIKRLLIPYMKSL
jgi:hypothetical protein